MVNFEQPWLQVSVYQDIESKYLEAQTILYILTLARPKDVVDCVDAWKQSLHANRLDLGPNAIGMFLSSLVYRVVLVNMIENGSDWSLVTYIVPFSVFVVLESFDLFVDVVVGQVHAQIIEVV